MPKILEKALKQQIERWEKYGSPLPHYIGNNKETICYDGENISNIGKCLDQTSGKPYCNQGENIGLECYDARGSKNHVCEPVYCLQGNGIDRADTAGCNGCGWREDKSYTLNTIDRPAVVYSEDKVQYSVRRITPLECCRLQGFPDWWVKDVPHSDSQEYKMWGNGMALPNALYVMQGIVEE